MHYGHKYCNQERSLCAPPGTRMTIKTSELSGIDSYLELPAPFYEVAAI
jgi:hypothetical protein